MLIVVLIFHLYHTHSPADRSREVTFDICRGKIKNTHLHAAFYYIKSAKWLLLFNKYHQQKELSGIGILLYIFISPAARLSLT